MNSSTSKHDIGSRIRAIRNAKNMTQRDLYNNTQIQETVISQYENGKKNPSLDTLALIARALKVSLDELYYGNKNERFINEAVDEAELIVNCYYELWKHGAVDSYRKWFDPDNYKDGMLYAISYPTEIEDFIDKLNDYSKNKESYENPEEFVNAIKNSIANRIRNKK